MTVLIIAYDKIIKNCKQLGFLKIIPINFENPLIK